jgi:hypothetical protein
MVGNLLHIRARELIRFQVEIKCSIRWEVTEDRGEIHHLRSAQREISPRRFCGFHPLPT